MSPTWKSILGMVGPQLPAIAALGGVVNPLLGMGLGVLAAMGQHLIEKATATPDEILAAIQADPAAAIAKLKPLDEYLAQIIGAVTAGASQTPAADLPAAAGQVVNGIAFATDAREIALGMPDADGRSVFMIYLSKAATSQFVEGSK